MGSLHQRIECRRYGSHFSPQSEINRLYRAFASTKSLAIKPGEESAHGSVFGLAFSPTGDVLVAACEKNSILAFDPYSHQKIKTIADAHADCVNCIRFLDSRIFLSCSDDTTVGVWDLRKLGQKAYSLVGHRDWVKSIEYCDKTRLVITAGFDDTIRLWDLNEFSSGAVQGRVVMSVRFIARIVLSPDSAQLVVSSTIGMLAVIQNLDLQSLERDFCDFKMAECWFDHRKEDFSYLNGEHFTREKNKLKFCSDVLPEMDPLAITSLQMHPKGECLLTRFTSSIGDREWSALYVLDDALTPDGNPKLCRYVEEPNKEREYIKEPCFSYDGRITFSPFSFGLRLLACDDICGEAVGAVLTQEIARPFSEVKTLISHRNTVLSTRCSPVHMLLASGCLGGNVCFYQPRI